MKYERRSFLGAGFALVAASCGPPPCPSAPGGAATGSAAAAALPVLKPLEFTHTSNELMAKAKLGWNLGNSLDVPDGETAWGNPAATPELFSAVAKAGFSLVRIPVTWSKHMGAAPDFTIEPGWFQRVDEVIGQARAAGLYVVVNTHHDGADGFKGVQWIALKDEQGKTTEENNAAVRARFVTVWTQIAKHFAGYGEELLFESMNEIHDGYGAPDPRHFEIINALNQEFVKVVRSMGGNNEKRHLVVPGYNTNIDHTLKGFKLPNDTIPNRLTLSVHFYDPYLFTLEGKTHTWGTASPDRDNWGQEDFVVGQFDKLKTTYVDQGVGILLGEYGATHQAGFEDYQRYWVEYVTKAAVDRGICPVYWDNGGSGSGNDKFGLFDRASNTPLHPPLMEALKRAGTSNYKLTDVALPKPSK